MFDSIPMRTAIWRFGRVLIYGAVTGGVAALLAYMSVLDGTTTSPFLVAGTALLTAFDKWFREHRYWKQDDEAADRILRDL